MNQLPEALPCNLWACTIVGLKPLQREVQCQVGVTLIDAFNQEEALGIAYGEKLKMEEKYPGFKFEILLSQQIVGAEL